MYNSSYTRFLSNLVREMRLELTRLLPHAPQTCLSTYSSTLAFNFRLLGYYNHTSRVCQVFYFFLAGCVQFIIMCERANKLRRTYFFTQKRRRGYEIRVLKARGAADYRGNVRKGRKAGRDCRACRQVPSDHIPRARARQDRGNGLPLSSRV